MQKHRTNLLYHFKQKHTWFDVFLLTFIWSLVFYIPETLWSFYGISLLFLVKITALVATLEFISFIVFHLFSGQKSLLIQGFFGGFISSTTVFVQLNYDKRFSHVEEKSIADSLLMAICSMLIECHLILFSIVKMISIQMILPFTFMLLFISIFIYKSVYLKKTKLEKNLQINDLKIDDPIVWKKVFIFSLFIILLKTIMVLIQNFTTIPLIAAVFLTSIFEAHAVLAVNASAFSPQTELFEIYQVILVILMGSLISKLFLVLKGQNIRKKKLVLIPIATSTLLTFIASFILLKIF